MASESRKTVLVAMGANAGIAVAKGIGGAISGSSAMLAEAAHSLADTTNQVFLLVSLHRGKRPADDQHPFGYGQERFFWAFLAAVFIFVAGAAFSVWEGVERLLNPPSEGGGLAVPLVVLAIALALETTSLVRAARQTRGEAREAGLAYPRFVRQSREPTSKLVVFEDSAAVIGVLLAIAGITLAHVTGHEAWDAGASIAIGLLLAVVAVSLGRDTKGLLLGEGARPEERERMREVIESHREVAGLLDLRTMALGPSSLLVAARIDLADGLDSDGLEQLSERIDRELREAVPDVREVFLDATPRTRAREGRAT